MKHLNFAMVLVSMDVEEILRKVKNGEISVEDAFAILKDLPFMDMDFAKIDFHRRLRRDMAEVIYAPGKSIEQIKKIAEEMAEREKVFITKANEEIYRHLQHMENSRYYEKCGMIVIGEKAEKRNEGYMVVVSAGSSDAPVAEEAAVTAEELGNEVHRIYDVGAAGFHRIIPYREEIEKARVVIVVAGMDGVLPTLVSNFASSIIIAVPTSIGYGTGLNGVAALMAMLNSCSPGIVVVNIDNGFGAGVAAHMIMRW